MIYASEAGYTRPNMLRIACVALTIFTLCLPLHAGDEEESVTSGFRAGLYRTAKGKELPYRLFVPAAGDSGSRYPLVLFLHGFEALGKDNKKQISGMDYAGSHVWTKSESQRTYPCFVLAPQCPKGSFWANTLTRKPSGILTCVVDLIRELMKQYPIDPDRLYVTGQSLGGFGTWALLTYYNDMFAAGVPVCGGGRTRAAASLRNVPIWAFHGAGDPIVIVFESRRMISAIRKAGGMPRYTEYQWKLHNIWNRAYAEPELLEWLFQQRRQPAGADQPSESDLQRR